MLFHIRHVTTFTYSAPVACDPLVVRLRPREDAIQRLHEFRLEVNPRPAGRSDWLDLDGNQATCLWFAGVISALEVRTSATVETRRTNPYDFLLYTAARNVPPEYSPAEQSLSSYYARPLEVSTAVADFARQVLSAAQGRTTAFLSELCARIHGRCRTEIRDTGDPWSAEQTLAERRGACRDLAVLFNEACRAVGLPARFVSGYGYGLGANQEQHLHAWSEVYLPGGGWRAYDPSVGLAVADHHIPLAASRLPQGAAPTSGTFSGLGVTSTIAASVEVVHENGQPPAQIQNQNGGRPMMAQRAKV